MKQIPKVRFPPAAVGLAACSILAVAAAVGNDPRMSGEFMREYDAQVPKTILELQPFRQISTIRITSGGGRVATLVNLNPDINTWYLLSTRSEGGGAETFYHLENPRPRERKLLLDQNTAELVIVEGTRRMGCDVFGTGNVLEQARTSRLPFYPLCEDRLYLRNPATGRRTTLEATADFLRDHVWGGEGVLRVGHLILGDRYRETGKLQAAPGGRSSGGVDLPLPALIDSQSAARGITSANLGIALESAPPGGMTPGLASDPSAVCLTAIVEVSGVRIIALIDGFGLFTVGLRRFGLLRLQRLVLFLDLLQLRVQYRLRVAARGSSRPPRWGSCRGRARQPDGPSRGMTG
jgi:hypothetical protein